ncbi:hypothetical protein WOLCODRAFT_127575 [Wolfiporia cocos MD-104 SS10]|uniref:PH domain-containing protein n=1 Tax=Wolfiporia cocos (strain MD-104) TaxID=742152 RepID=A0A2H3JL37_WOLCO|nr:hypothetical protein WOLCODRAFT_127575 [Wolfiporia cocos MD-104 SS10]
MASGLPLRDRLPSNSPEQDAPWLPLRIAKRDSPQPPPPAPAQGAQLARRQSTSYNHLRHNNLVTNSPFRAKSHSHSQSESLPAGTPPIAILAPLPRRVSGEKRPRPNSLQSQAENEHPLGFKRRQSKVFQGLLQAESVSKSPFKQPEPTPAEPQQQSPILPQSPPQPQPQQPQQPQPEAQPQPPPAPAASPQPAPSPPLPPIPPPSQPQVQSPPSTSQLDLDEPLPPPPKPPYARDTPSPSRPSLVSKRLHGPRTAGLDGSLNSRRRRRKTVTFDERCDVVEFDVEEGEFDSDPFASESDEYASEDDDDGEDGVEGEDYEVDEEDTPRRTHAYLNERAARSLPSGLEHTPRRGSGSAHTSAPRAAPADTASSPRVPVSGPAASPPTQLLSPLNAPLASNGASRDPRAISPLPEVNVNELLLRVSPQSRAHDRDSPDYSDPDEIDLNVKDEPFTPDVSFGSDDSYADSSTDETGPILGHDPTAASLAAESSMETDVDAKSEETGTDAGRDAVDATADTAHVSQNNSPAPAPEAFDPPRPERPLSRSPALRPTHALSSARLERHSPFRNRSSSRGESDLQPPASVQTDADANEPSASIAQQLRATSLEDPELSPPPTVPPLPSTPSRSPRVLPNRPSFDVDQSVDSGEGDGDVMFSTTTRPLSLAFAGEAPSPRSPFTRAADSQSPLRHSVDLSLSSLTFSRSPLKFGGALFAEEEQGIDEGKKNERAEEREKADDVEAANAAELAKDADRMQVDSQPQSSNADHEMADSTEEVAIEPDTEMTPEMNRAKQTDSSAPTPLPAMSRLDNATHDGVLSLDPAPQPIDPPRPSFLVRAQTTDPAARPLYATSDPKELTIELDGGADAPGSPPSSVCLGDVSALDRLMENVANGGLQAGSDDVHMSEGQSEEVADDERQSVFARRPNAVLHSRALSAPPQAFEDLQLPSSTLAPISPVDASADQPVSPPLPPPKDAIRAREELIRAKKRAARRKEEQATLGPGVALRVAAMQEGRTPRRRSRSTGDAENMLTVDPDEAQRRAEALRSEGLLGALEIKDEGDPLADSIDRELRKLVGPNKSRYHVREHRATIYASSDAGHGQAASGEHVDDGRPWRTLKRFSDVNEHARLIQELRTQEQPEKAHGKVFVKVVGLKNINVPLPSQPTIVSCTLNNGTHFVTTPECRLHKECRIDQEFELVESKGLEFTLSIKVRRDPHIVAQFQANTPPPPPPPVIQAPPAPPPASKGGKRKLFWGSQPKKSVQPPPRPVIVNPPAPVHRMVENLARYLKSDGTLARVFISFRDIAKRCDTKLFETTYPLFGQWSETPTVVKTLQVGEIILQIFRLPALHGIPLNLLPQSLEECHRGLRNTYWHKQTYFEGTLTQNGGDCKSWRRRHLRLIGGNLVAYNDITKKITAAINLRKAIAVEDDQDSRAALLSPGSGISPRSRHLDEFEGPYGSERSFRLMFPNDEEIVFFADTDEEKAKWLEVLRALVGRVPPNPLWAELVWQRQQELNKQTSPKTANASLSHR